jgi:hypothetical protein
VDAAENLTFLLHPVSNDAATTMRTSRREPLDRAFEAVKNMTLSVESDFKSFVVVISANLTFSHIGSSGYSSTAEFVIRSASLFVSSGQRGCAANPNLL